VSFYSIRVGIFFYLIRGGWGSSASCLVLLSLLFMLQTSAGGAPSMLACMYVFRVSVCELVSETARQSRFLFSAYLFSDQFLASFQHFNILSSPLQHLFEF